VTTSSIIKTDGKAIVLDLSRGARLFDTDIAGLAVDAFSALIERKMREAGTLFAFGRYAEPRALYSNENFASPGSPETRTIHMGIDLFCSAETPVCAPLDGTVACLANNDSELDYGPVIVLKHIDSEGTDFFTLYGHLSLSSLDGLRPGDRVSRAQQIATVGAPPVNGNWPPHLHFQLIRDLLDLGVDFPGVALYSQRAYWLALSPSPAAFFPEMDQSSLEYPHL
jgi:murein DD-endopeptidase MepM/ murein hydrolase activator NlpD